MNCDICGLMFLRKRRGVTPLPPHLVSLAAHCSRHRHCRHCGRQEGRRPHPRDRDHDEHLVAPRRRVWPVASHLDLRLRQGACRSACNPTASAPRMTHDACRACCAAGTEAPLHDPLREARCVGCAVQGGGDRDASALASLHGVRSDGTLYSLQERIALWRQRSGRALRARPRIMRGRPAQR